MFRKKNYRIQREQSGSLNRRNEESVSASRGSGTIACPLNASITE